MWRWLKLRKSSSPHALGRRGEALAARYVKRRGMRIVARGKRLRPGELDLVAVDGGTIVFIEVKTRTSTEAGHPVLAVDANKQQRLTRLALAYLKGHGLLEYPARFDVVAITWPEQGSSPEVEYFENAFEATDRGQMFS